MPAAVSAQWYQGPSGGSGGSPFDHWQQSNKARNIVSFTVLQDSSIGCIYIGYNEPVASSNQFKQLRSGYCDPPPGELSFNGSRGIGLDDDENILGI